MSEIDIVSESEANATEQAPRKRTSRAASSKESTATKARKPRKKASDAVSHDAEEVKSAVAESLAEITPKARKPRAKKIVDIELESLGEVTNSQGAEAAAAEVPAEKQPTTRKRRPRKSAETKAVASESTPGATEATTEEAPEPAEQAAPIVPPMTALLFQEPDTSRVRRRASKKVREAEEVLEPAEVIEAAEAAEAPGEEAAPAEDSAEPRRRRRGSRGRRKSSTEDAVEPSSDSEATDGEAQAEPAEEETEEQPRRRRRRSRERAEVSDEVTAPKGSTRLEAKRQRRKEGREAGRRRHTISESEYLARRESVKREMLVREQDGLNQIAVLEDDVLVEHYVARHTQVSMVGNVYLGRVQNVLPSMEAAFVDIGKGRNAVLYAGEVNWEAAGLEGKPRRIEQALKSGDTVLVQVTKDPIGHKGARLTAQITLAGRHLVLVPSGAMTGISRKLPDRERQRLKKLLREIVPSEHGVIVRTAAEGATEEQLRADVDRLTKAWDDIQKKAKNTKSAPTLLKGEPELAVRVVRDIFNEDFQSLSVQGDGAWQTISDYVGELSPELSERLIHWTDSADIFAKRRVDEQLAKAFDRKVWLPSGGTLIIDRTEAMTVIDVNTGKFTGSGGTLEETVTRNNLEAAEEIVRQLRLRDIGGIIVVDFIDMVLEANRELVLRRLVECLGRDRTRHQVAEVTSLGLVQMTRKRVGQGLVEAFSTTCEACEGRGYITHTHPVEHGDVEKAGRRKKKADAAPAAPAEPEEEKHEEVRAALSSIAAAASHKHGDAEAAAEASEAQAEAKPKRKRARKLSGDAAAERKAPASKAGSERAEAAEAGQNKADDSSMTPDATVEASASAVSDALASSEEPKAASRSRRGRGTGAKKSVLEAAHSPEPATTGEQALPASAGMSESGSSSSASVDGAANAGTEAPAKPAARRRRVSSSGTITPGAGTGAAILSFPAK